MVSHLIVVSINPPKHTKGRDALSRGPVSEFCGAIGGYSREAYGTENSSV